MVITAIDNRTENGAWWFIPRYAGPMTDWTTWSNKVYMTSVQDFADNVLGMLGSASLDMLNVCDHGNANGLEIGSDWVTLGTIGNHSGNLGRFSGKWTSGTRGMFLQNCNVGQNTALLVQLAGIVGAKVTAGTGLSNPIYGFNTGNYVECHPDGTIHTGVSRPRAPAAPRRPIDWSRKMCCFAAGTPVSTPHGPLPIEMAQPGDAVFAWDVASQSVRTARVLELERHVGSFAVNAVGSIGVTDSHRFAASSGRWLPVEQVRGAAPLKAIDGYALARLRRHALPRTDRVFNLRVASAGSYFAGDERLLVRDH